MKGSVDLVIVLNRPRVIDAGVLAWSCRCALATSTGKGLIPDVKGLTGVAVGIRT
jgi:hypothetical protein